MRRRPADSPYWVPEMELSRDELAALSDMAIHRYNLWRRRKRNPLTRDEAYSAALALTRNDDEQRQRAYQHDTGAVA